MFIPTHMLIANCVNKAIEDNNRFKLNSECFLYGNIKPDITPKFIAIPHYKDASFEYIMKMIASIEIQTLPTSAKQLKSFSVMLGVINHYLTDYFCYAHNNKSLDKFAPHMLYENKLAIKFYSTDLKRICNNSITAVSRNHNQYIRDYVEFKHYEYMNIKPSMNKDILYSVEVCAAVSYLIVYNCINNVLINIA